MVKNYPKIMIPMFRHNRWVALYFAAFLIINNILIFKIVVGIIRINYKNMMA